MASSQFSLEGKVAIITGSSSGIGEAIAIEYVRQGALVTLNGRNVQNLRGVEKKCTDLAGGAEKVLTIVGDITEENVRIQLIEDTIKKFGRIDILVNNAGTYDSKPLADDFEVCRLDAMLDIHVRAPFHLIKLAIPHLVKSKGNVINISSVVGSRALGSEFTEYAIAKSALDHLTRIAALELGPMNVRVNGISPGTIETPIFKRMGLSSEQAKQMLESLGKKHALGRYGRSEEIASAAIYLSSDGASFITGHTLAVDGGIKIMPPSSTDEMKPFKN